MIVTPEIVSETVRDLLGWPRHRKWEQKAVDTKCRSFFGAPTSVISNLWNMLNEALNLDDTARPKHLLYAMVFIKVYSTEDVHCRIVGWPDPKTFRKWSWYFLEKIASLRDDVLSLDNRFDGWNGITHCLMSIDGTDCMVNEPWPFEKKWYSEKFNGPGVKYEVGVSITKGEIVWINGPFVASMNDATIFKKDLAQLLCENEGVEADAGYKGHDQLKSKQVSVSRDQRVQKAGVRSRHEIVNGRLKQFDVLNTPFRHLKPKESMMQKHGYCFFACAVITQLKMKAGETLYDVEYTIGYF